MNPIDSSPAHGGDIVSASQHYRIPIDHWIDLSTGINPKPYPVTIASESFQRLPYLQIPFIEASTQYYGNASFLPVAGTQAAIQQLPDILSSLPIFVPEIGYQEHAWCWQQAGEDVRYYPSCDNNMAGFINCELEKNQHSHWVIINPNNPTGVLVEREQLYAWAKKLAPGAYLIIDEAFIDMTPAKSVLDSILPNNIIVLRSFGKFFGLAGIRLGYCFANQQVLSVLQKRLGVWQVNGPAQAIAIQALQDTVWQQQAIEDVKKNAAWMQACWQPLMSACSDDVFYSSLFSSWQMPLEKAQAIYEYFAQAGILLRVIPLHKEQALLRIGLVDHKNLALAQRVYTHIESAYHHFCQQLLPEQQLLKV